MKKNRILVAVAAVVTALALILPVQAAPRGGAGSGHAHGPHTNPQGKAVGNGDPSFNQSWWYQPNANQTQIQDWGGVTTSGDWPVNSVEWDATLTLIDTTTNNPYYQQPQTTYDNTGPNLTSPWEVINPGDNYKMEWHMVGTLLQPGWSWGAPGTSACSVSGDQMICDYTVNQVLIPLVATATPQATNTPVATDTPVVPPTATPQATATAANCQLGITAVYMLGGEQALVQINTSPAADNYTVFISWSPATTVPPERFTGVGNGEFLTVFVGGTGSFRFSIEGTDTTTNTTCSGGTTGPVIVM